MSDPGYWVQNNEDQEELEIKALEMERQALLAEYRELSRKEKAYKKLSKNVQPYRSFSRASIDSQEESEDGGGAWYKVSCIYYISTF